MDKLSVQQKTPKQARAKKKPIKVVYISNPVRVKATASQFKGVVQELTGRDSDVAELSMLADVEEEPAIAGRQSSGFSGVADHSVGTSVAAGEQDDHQQRGRWRQQQEHELYGSVGIPVDVFDGVFTPPVLEDHAACLPTSLYHDHILAVDNIRRWGDAA